MINPCYHSKKKTNKKSKIKWQMNTKDRLKSRQLVHTIRLDEATGKIWLKRITTYSALTEWLNRQKAEIL